MTTVIDAGFAINWLLAKDGSAVDRTLEAAEPGGLIAPVIFWHEVGSALRTLGQRGVLTRSERDYALVRAAQLGVEIDGDAPEIGRVLQVSDRFNLTVYDAAYLELASRTGSNLASDDNALKQSAAKIGLTVVSP